MDIVPTSRYRCNYLWKRGFNRWTKNCLWVVHAYTRSLLYWPNVQIFLQCLSTLSAHPPWSFLVFQISSCDTDINKDLSCGKTVCRANGDASCVNLKTPRHSCQVPGFYFLAYQSIVHDLCRSVHLGTPTTKLSLPVSGFAISQMIYVRNALRFYWTWDASAGPMIPCWKAIVGYFKDTSEGRILSCVGAISASIQVRNDWMAWLTRISVKEESFRTIIVFLPQRGL